MKKAAVATTAASGAAVSSSRITAVQSVYMGCVAGRFPSFQPPVAFRQIRRWTGSTLQCPAAMAALLPAAVMASFAMPRFRALIAAGPLASLLVLLGLALPVAAGVRFENCVTAADGSISCDTVPTGNTLMRDVDARYGLLDNASPGWSEFDPYAGYEDDFGGNQT